jgi:DNA excision repair protein ERCC-4
MTAIFDTREPDPHPWAPYLPEGWRMVRGTLETGDFALAALPEGVVIERKTPSDLAGCIGKGRERFERELRRGRYVGRLIVVVEGDLRDVIEAAPGIKPAAVIGSLAAWTARYAPFVFAGGVRAAADFSFRALSAQVRTIEREAKALREANESL